MKRTIVVFILVLLSSNSFGRDSNPLCWKTYGVFHTDSGDGHMSKFEGARFRISKSPEKLPKENRVFSENKAYAFVAITKKARPYNAEVLIFTEKEYTVKLGLIKLQSATPKWINEKTLLIRIWWGRAMGEDMFFDVEEEKIIARQGFRDTGSATSDSERYCSMEQWKEKEVCNPKCSTID